jgi:hypothetical protein
MGRKNVNSWAALDAVNATLPQTSDYTTITSIDKMSIYCKFSAANSGSFVVEVANSNPGVDALINWYELDFGAPLTITAESECQILLTETPFQLIRLKWVPTSGAGTLTATYYSKMVGG